MFFLREYKQRSARLSDWLPWGFLIEDDVLLNKDGAYVATLEFRGPDMASSTPSIMMALRAQINHALKGLGSSWCVHVEAQRVPSPHYPGQGAFPDPISRLIDEERRRDFSREGRFFESRYFATFTMLPPGERASKLASLMVENAPTGTGTAGIYKAAQLHFTNTVNSILDLFRASMPFARRLTSDELLTYLHSTVSTKNHPVKTPAVPAWAVHGPSRPRRAPFVAFDGPPSTLPVPRRLPAGLRRNRVPARPQEPVGVPRRHGLDRRRLRASLPQRARADFRSQP
jgi:type IV secretory pathway VirB4 component